MRRRLFLTAVASMAACRAPDSHRSAQRRSARPRSAGNASEPAPSPNASAPEQRRSYDALLADIQTRRRTLAERAGSDAAPLEEARRAITRSITDEIAPAWLGTRWAFHGTAVRPRAPEGIACGYFVATVLQHAGLRLASRTRFGQAAALKIQRALTPDPESLRRIYSVPAATLERRIRAFGPGLYIIGLNVHVGFVVVRDEQVRLVHASYTGDRLVTDEPLVDAEAIHASREAGYFVTPLFRDRRLVKAWLEQTVVAAPS